MDGKRSLPYLFVNLIIKHGKRIILLILLILLNSFKSCKSGVNGLCISCKYENKLLYCLNITFRVTLKIFLFKHF